MKERLNLWASQNARVPGARAFCLLYPDRTQFTMAWTSQFPPDAMDNAWRCVADTFQVLQLNRFPTGWVRYVFSQTFIYAARRPEGPVFALITGKDDPGLEPERLDRILQEFLELPLGEDG